MTWSCLRFAVVLLCCAVSSHANSATSQVAAAEPSGVKSTVWSFGVTGLQENLKGSNNHQLIGPSTAIQIGYGHLAEDWLAIVSADILQGPYQPTYDSQLQVDYAGFGLSAWTGLSAQKANLRSPEGGYGFALGLSLGTLKGVMIGRNRLDTADGDTTNKDRVDSYTMTLSKLSLVPGVFFTWLTGSRPHGNTPDLLKTRIEGYVLMVGAATPMFATYTAAYTQGTVEERRDSGSLSGYSIMVNFTALLGV
ncbi:MAG: hypothetical protein FJ146_18525 [Deltaproteobacteria bacterium]|nr:hypothetical protein [Deltaproteobacteria bacterium]